MGRSTPSCFKIISCGSDSVDKDDAEPYESKDSTDKHRWSFRKRSATHRVLSNTIISETPSSSNKRSPETACANLQTRSNTTYPEKTSVLPWTDEIPQLSTSANVKVCDTRVATENVLKVCDTRVATDNVLKVCDTRIATENVLKVCDTRVATDNVLKVCDTKVATENVQMHDVNPDESVIVVIQATIRGFLAQRELLKLKNLVKLQAAVRGHLVRRHAVGTLRCLQAIIKIQALVRARRALIFREGSCTEGNSQEYLEKGNSVSKPSVMYTSIEKLLSNKFAQQLLESTPRTKRIHIKCDPSISDSAWKWIERWTSVSSVGVPQQQKPESRMEEQDQNNVDYSVCQVENGFASEGCESTDSKADITEKIMLSKNEENLITNDANDFDFQACQPSSFFESENQKPPLPENSGTSKESSLGLLPNQTKQPDSISQLELMSISSKPGTESEQSTHTVKMIVPEHVEAEGKNFLFGTRRATNPAFIAVQSKFEELSSTVDSARLTSFYNKDVGVEPKTESISSAMDNAIKLQEIGLTENSVISRVKVAGSECGTELSISSTLDSPDMFEIGAIEVEQVDNLSEEGTSNSNSSQRLDTEEAYGDITIPGTDLFYSIPFQSEKLDDGGVNDEPVNSVSAIDSLQEKQNLEINAIILQSKLDSEMGCHANDGAAGEPVNYVAALDSSQEKHKSEINKSNVQIELDLEMHHHIHTYKSSPEASSRSHMTVLETQGTPSSLVSVRAENIRSDRDESNQKHRSNPNDDSSARSSVEQLPKDHKTGKRRNSLGSGRRDYSDQEPRDSNSSSSLPNYMQATESARAKALANSSPISSPDVQEKDIRVKKRHSLPGANGRQGSPRNQRSKSHSQLGSKRNGHPYERKWQR